jgi:hypothetical protein
MKVKEYIRTFFLYKQGTRIKSKKLADQLGKDFDELIMGNNGHSNINEFNACVDKIINKIDSINMKAQTEIHEGFVRYFYATVILEKKRHYFPEVVARDEVRYSQNSKK